MNRRKLILVLVAAAIGFGVVALPAAAELHSVTAVLVTGERITTTVDIPAGMALRDVSIPGVTGTIKEVLDNGPVEVPTPGPIHQVPDAPALPSPTGTPMPGAPEVPAGEPEARNRKEGDAAGLDGSKPTRPKRNQSFGAGSINPRDLVGELEGPAHEKDPGRAIDGTPTPDNPTFSLALPGAAPIGVPNFFIDKFRIPPFLLPIYQAAGIQYGVRWEVLAAINEIETDYGR
ncbi:MAG TPA: hypothetical protein VES79_03890, partial [Solirubrobacteraceae bacterium]|nr:hypothetical protein [Solirubrobacteraceae bacterium]